MRDNAGITREICQMRSVSSHRCRPALTSMSASQGEYESIIRSFEINNTPESPSPPFWKRDTVMLGSELPRRVVNLPPVDDKSPKLHSGGRGCGEAYPQALIECLLRTASWWGFGIDGRCLRISSALSSAAWAKLWLLCIACGSLYLAPCALIFHRSQTDACFSVPLVKRDVSRASQHHLSGFEIQAIVLIVLLIA